MKLSDNMESQEQRLDRWLNISCLFKTRAQATKACDDRRVKVNGTVAKPAKMITGGDQLTIKGKRGKYRNVIVKAISLRNIPAKDAKLLYEAQEPDLSPEESELLAFYQEASKELRPKYKGRPTKKERRKLKELKERHSPWS